MTPPDGDDPVKSSEPGANDLVGKLRPEDLQALRRLTGPADASAVQSLGKAINLARGPVAPASEMFAGLAHRRAQLEAERLQINADVTKAIEDGALIQDRARQAQVAREIQQVELLQALVASQQELAASQAALLDEQKSQGADAKVTRKIDVTILVFTAIGLLATIAGVVVGIIALT